MMKTVLAASAAVIALGAAPAAFAQAGPAQAYVNFGASYFMGDDVEIPVAGARAGVNIGPNFGLEAEAGFGLSDDTVGGASVEIDHIIGGFARLRAPVGPAAEIFARLGYYTMEASATGGGLTVSADDEDFAAGLGAEFSLGGRTGLRLDYTNYGFDDSHALSAALVVNF